MKIKIKRKNKMHAEKKYEIEIKDRKLNLSPFSCIFHRNYNKSDFETYF